MEISSLLKDYKMPVKKSRRTERGDLLDYFLERVNASRKDSGFKELTMKRLAFLLSPFSVSELYLLRMKCDTAQEWSKCFYFYTQV